MKEGYTVIIVSKKGGRFQFFIRKRLFYLVASLFLALVLLVLITTVFYSSLYKEVLRARFLKMENARLRKENAKVVELARRLEELEKFRKRVSEMLGLQYSPPPPDIGFALKNEGERESRPPSSASFEAKEKAAEELPPSDEYVPSGMPVKGVISRTFSREHPGIDIVAPLGSPVIATASGIVLRAFYSERLGNQVLIDHNGQYRTLYGHLDRIFVKPGDKVKRGEIIGSVGTSGLSTGPHLHYEVLQKNARIDPLLFVQG